MEGLRENITASLPLNTHWQQPWAYGTGDRHRSHQNKISALIKTSFVSVGRWHHMLSSFFCMRSSAARLMHQLFNSPRMSSNIPPYEFRSIFKIGLLYLLLIPMAANSFHRMATQVSIKRAFRTLGQASTRGEGGYFRAWCHSRLFMLHFIFLLYIFLIIYAYICSFHSTSNDQAQSLRQG